MEGVRVIQIRDDGCLDYVPVEIEMILTIALFICINLKLSEHLLCVRRCSALYKVTISHNHMRIKTLQNKLPILLIKDLEFEPRLSYL